MRAVLAALFLLPMASCQPAYALPSSVSVVLAQISAHCGGYQLLSEFRRGAHVAGTHRRSLHSYGLAADFRVSNYGCAYGLLSGWQHGLSLDAGRMRHIHISDGSSIGRKEGRFFHQGGRHRYASRHRQGRHFRRYARG